VPEGDTIHKIAAYMAPVLTGAAIDGVTIGTRRCAEFEGRTVHSVEARGKHLWIGIGKELGIRSHLGMHGSWHVYTLDEPWQRPRRQASLVVDASGKRWVCFNAKEIEIVDTPGVRDNILRSTLGPDLIVDDPDPALLVRRAREFDDGDSLLIDTMLNQRVAAGIGNVYKSEVMFLNCIPPTQSTAGTDDAVIAACFRTATELLATILAAVAA
jgi:endonuclease-8